MATGIHTVVTTRYWHLLDNGKVQCDLCPRFCKLGEGQRGLCFVRGREQDQIKLFSYGRSSGFCIDPIEKKPLNHFLPGTSVLSFGTAGCNLACKFCQNWDMSKSREMDTLADEASPDMLVSAASQHRCKSIAYTYNDPVIFTEYAVDVAKAAHRENIKSVAVTAGYICPEPRKDFFQHIDAANIDLKAFTEDFYHKICGAHLKDVLETLVYVRHSTDTWLELTTLLIPGENDSDAELEKMTRWVVSELGPDVPMHFTAFHPDWKMMNHPVTPPATLTRARELAMANGVRYAYTGNVFDPKGQSTRCHHCQAMLIQRNGYWLDGWGLDENGCCSKCSTPLPGFFEPQPGHWGNRRVPIRLAS